MFREASTACLTMVQLTMVLTVLSAHRRSAQTLVISNDFDDLVATAVCVLCSAAASQTFWVVRVVTALAMPLAIVLQTVRPPTDTAGAY